MVSVEDVEVETGLMREEEAVKEVVNVDEDVVTQQGVSFMEIKIRLKRLKVQVITMKVVMMVMMMVVNRREDVVEMMMMAHKEVEAEAEAVVEVKAEAEVEMKAEVVVGSKLATTVVVKVTYLETVQNPAKKEAVAIVP